jgi:hypothetical protein
MSLMPFNKHNCVAMLNTLYPPVVAVAPTAKLRPEVLTKQREGFLRYIKGVETKGVGTLLNLQKQDSDPGEDNGWSRVHRNLMKYLHLANRTIAECQDASFTPQPINPAPATPLPRIPETPGRDSPSRHENAHRKADSGVGLNSRPQSKMATEPSSPPSSRRPSAYACDLPKMPSTPRRSALSTLERIAKELMSLGKSKPEIEEIIPAVPKTPSKVKESKESKTPNTLRKMRSLGALSELKHSNASSTTLQSRLGSKKSLLFDKQTMRGERLAYEERTGINRSRLGYSDDL